MFPMEFNIQPFIRSWLCAVMGRFFLLCRIHCSLPTSGKSGPRGNVNKNDYHLCSKLSAHHRSYRHDVRITRWRRPRTSSPYPFHSPYLQRNTFTYIYFPLLTCPLFHIHVPCTRPNVMRAFSYSIDKYFTLRTRTSVVWLPRANTEVNIYLLSFYLLYWFTCSYSIFV